MIIVEYKKKELVHLMTTKRNSEQSISLSSQLSDMKVIKRDGRLVNFNAQKKFMMHC